jgi:hypothetical protein
LAETLKANNNASIGGVAFSIDAPETTRPLKIGRIWIQYIVANLEIGYLIMRSKVQVFQGGFFRGISLGSSSESTAGSGIWCGSRKRRSAPFVCGPGGKS